MIGRLHLNEINVVVDPNYALIQTLYEKIIINEDGVDHIKALEMICPISFAIMLDPVTVPCCKKKLIDHRLKNFFRPKV